MSIPDKITNDFLKLLANERTWTGGYLKSKGQWAWTDGSEWKYTNWKQGQPDFWEDEEDVLEMSGIGWNDGKKSYKLGTLCQYNPRQ